MARIKLTKYNLIEAVEKASQVFKNGNAVIFPTDTLYALGVDALNINAVERFFALKKRLPNKPVPLFVKDIQMAKELAFIDKKHEKILWKLWPGIFTFIFFKKNKISSRISGETEKVGLRIPDNFFAQALLNKFNSPITASSANISGMEATTDLDKIIKQFSMYSLTPDLIIDAGILKNIEPSTVVDMTSKEPKLLRINQTTLAKMQEIFDI